MSPHNQLNDEELIRMYLRTEQNNYFEVLYNRYANKVYSRCLSLTKDMFRAEDYTHDIFLRVYGNLGKFREHSAFSTWLYSISYNYCMDQLRPANQTVIVALDKQHENTLTESGDYELVEAKLQQLAAAMKAITAEETRMLQLRYEDSLGIKGIAQRLSLNDSTVKMRLKRTRDKIRRLYIAHDS